MVHQLLTDRRPSVTVIVLQPRHRTERGGGRRDGNRRASSATSGGRHRNQPGQPHPEHQHQQHSKIVRQARILDPEPSPCRSAHLHDAPGLTVRASIVAAGEAEVGMALAEAVTADDAAPQRRRAERHTVRARLSAPIVDARVRRLVPPDASARGESRRPTPAHQSTRSRRSSSSTLPRSSWGTRISCHDKNICTIRTNRITDGARSSQRFRVTFPSEQGLTPTPRSSTTPASARPCSPIASDSHNGSGAA